MKFKPQLPLLKKMSLLAFGLSTSLILGGCGNSGDIVFEGSVGDGPIVNARVTVQDSLGNVIYTGYSDNSAKYQFRLPKLNGSTDSYNFPLVITAENGSGVDLVTNTPPTFSMQSVVYDENQKTANINPFSTLIVGAATRMPGGLTESNLTSATTTVMNKLAFGLDENKVPDPIKTAVTDDNVAEIVKSSEALAEMVRRTSRSLNTAGSSYSDDDVFEKISEDITDGDLDGSGTNLTDSRVSATANVVSSQVLLESMINQLKVGEIDVTQQLDQAIVTTMPTARTTTADVNITATMITQAKSAVSAANLIAPSNTLNAISSSLNEISANSKPSEIAENLPSSSAAMLRGAVTEVATVPDTVIDQANEIFNQNDSTDEPTSPDQKPNITFVVDSNTIEYANGVNLSWNVKNSTDCLASGGWAGTKESVGSESISSLTANTSFTLTCNGKGGSRSKTVAVAVSPLQAPSLALTSSSPNIGFNETSTLNWSSSRADTCVASGGWSGIKETAGSFQTNSLTSDTSFTLTCSGRGGSVTKTVAVNVSEPPIPSPTLTFSASPSSVVKGQATTLNWSANNASSCSASNGWTGSKSTSGTTTSGNLTVDTTFTLTCSGTSASVTKSVNIAVLPAPKPIVSFTATPSQVEYNGATVLAWEVENATGCSASGGWLGNKSLVGAETIDAITDGTTFTLTCSGEGGNTSKTVSVSVSAPPKPTIVFAADSTQVNTNEATTLTWSSTNADSCTASGGWSGNKSVSGSSSTEPLTSSTTFTISCTGTGGSTTKSVVVNVNPITGSATLSWTPPTTNEDGSNLDDLAGYKIHYGNSSGNYSNTITLNNPGVASYVIDNLVSGTYYFSVTAVDTSGNESIFSGEATKTIQ